MVDRRGFRAAGGAQPLQPLRPDLRRLLPAVRRHLHAGSTRLQQSAGAARIDGPAHTHTHTHTHTQTGLHGKPCRLLFSGCAIPIIECIAIYN
ncbi:MBL fold metallo-hydrolase [Rhizobium leguminosarum]|uniref:MBL fold metallo-hydrolase n=1 Tax=Rhizobium leguminosarum TaxID=384 RepID=UPI003D7A8585